MWRMLKRARKLGSARDIAILAAALVVVGGLAWLLVDRDGPEPAADTEPAAELARTQSPAPDAGDPAPAAAGGDRQKDTGGRQREPGHEADKRANDHERARSAAPPKEEDADSEAPIPPKAEAGGEQPNAVLEEILEGA